MKASGGSGSTVLFDDNVIEGVPAGRYEVNVRDNFGNDVVFFQDVTEPEELSVAATAGNIDGFNLNCSVVAMAGLPLSEKEGLSLTLSPGVASRTDRSLVPWPLVFIP